MKSRLRGIGDILEEWGSEVWAVSRCRPSTDQWAFESKYRHVPHALEVLIHTYAGTFSTT
jgi:hypothetical protein